MTAAEITTPHRPFYDLLGLWVDPRTDRATVLLPYKAELANSRGFVHGGATTSLLDAALARAVRLHDTGLASAVTVDMTVHFLVPGAGDLIGTATVISAGSTIAVAEARVDDQHGTCVARATGTFRLFTSRSRKEVSDGAQR